MWVSGLMGDNSSNSNSNSSSSNAACDPTHLPLPSSSSSAASHHWPKQMPFSSYYTGGEDSAAGGRGFHPEAFTHGAGKAPEPDFDAHDCDSEDGIGVLEEQMKQAVPRGSGSKRSRAAEVHNLSEKRRRSRINEKMKALQNLIPNSNKTDKASMLDEAIEYLKQLQLQVQMLSMRNGINLHPVYMPAALQPLQSSQMCMGFGVDNGSAMNMGVGMLPLKLESPIQNLYDPSNRCTSSHQSIILPNTTSMTTPGTSFNLGSSQTHHGSFPLPVAAEIFTEDMVPQGQLDSGCSTRNLRGSEMKSMAAAGSLHFCGEVSTLQDRDRLEGSALHGEHPEHVLSKDPDSHIFIQHFHGLQTGSSFPSDDVKTESPEFDA